MAPMFRLLCCLAMVGAAGWLIAGERNSADDFKPRLVTFKSPQLTLRDAMEEIEKQTGNAVRDARSNPAYPAIALPKSALSFWYALDAIGKQTGTDISTYQPDGGVALVDRQYRERTTHVSGAFRFTFKHIETSRDEETKAHLCRTTIDVAWEPRFRLMYLNLAGAKVTAGGQSEMLPGQPVRKVSGVTATDFELRSNAPPRAVGKLDAVTGTFRAVGAPRILDFKFEQPSKFMKLEIDGVIAKIKVTSQSPSRWSVDVDFEHPKDALLDVQSFENNDLFLFKYQGVFLKWNQQKNEMRPTSKDLTETGIRYHFDAKEAGQKLPAKDGDVVLHVHTPNRVVAFTVPFEFRDLALP